MEAGSASTHKIEAGGVGYWKVALRDEEPSGDLGERRELFPTREIPLQYDRICAYAVRHSIVRTERAISVKHGVHGNDVERPFEVTAYPSFADFWREHLANASAEHEEVELRRIARVSVGSEAGEKAKVPRAVAQRLGGQTL